MAKRAVMPMLPFELIVEILSWLPAKSLLRFKCVDKTWHSVISDPEFTEVQVSRSTDCHKLLVTTWPPQSIDSETFQVRKLNGLAPMETDDCGDPFYSIIGSCNGLVCVLDMFGDLFLIWNPTTGICSQIPNPNASLHCILLVGMGYNHSTDDYGVIFGSRHTSNGTGDAIIELYSRKTRAWKRIEVSGLDPESICTSPGLYLKGDLYYLTKGSGYNVVCFDMVEERFKVISPLPNMGTYFRVFGFVVYKNNLCVFIDHSQSSFECLMLRMEGNEVSFNRLFRYPHDKYSLSALLNAVCLTKKGEVVMDYGGWQLYLYDPEQDKGNERLRHDCHVESESYQESLISPDP